MRGLFLLLSTACISTASVGCIPQGIVIDPTGGELQKSGFEFSNPTNNPTVRPGTVVAIFTRPFLVLPVCQVADYGGSAPTDSGPVTISTSSQDKLSLQLTGNAQNIVTAAAGVSVDNSKVINMKVINRATDFAGNGPKALKECAERMKFVRSQYKPLLHGNDVLFHMVIQAAVATYDFNAKLIAGASVSADVDKAVTSNLVQVGGKASSDHNGSYTVTGAEQVVAFGAAPLNGVN